MSLARNFVIQKHYDGLVKAGFVPANDFAVRYGRAKASSCILVSFQDTPAPQKGCD